MKYEYYNIRNSKYLVVLQAGEAIAKNSVN